MVDRFTPPEGEQVEVRRRLADATRLVLDRLIASGAPSEMLATAAERMEAFAVTLADYPYGRTYQGFAEPANASQPNAFLDNSPLSGKANPIAPPMSLQQTGDRIHGRVRFGVAYEGPPGCVHGGFVAAAHDEILGMANSLGGIPGMTGTLTVKYLKPTPLHADLRMEAWFDRVEGRKQWCYSQLWAGDVLCNEAEGLFVTITPQRFKDLLDARDRQR